MFGLCRHCGLGGPLGIFLLSPCPSLYGSSWLIGLPSRVWCSKPGQPPFSLRLLLQLQARTSGCEEDLNSGSDLAKVTAVATAMENGVTGGPVLGILGFASYFSRGLGWVSGATYITSAAVSFEWTAWLKTIFWQSKVVTSWEAPQTLAKNLPWDIKGSLTYTLILIPGSG